MKKLLINFLLLLFITGSVFAQGTTKEKKKNTPVSFPWDSELLIDNQTTLIPPAKTLECIIQHRFGMINKNGFSDLFGLYAPGANIRIGINYTPVKKLTIGYGLTKKNMYSDFQVKWVLLQQTRSNSVPVAIAVFGDFAIDGRSNRSFGTTYKFIDRFSYFSQLIVSRKFSEWLSLEITGSFTHYNMVASKKNHDKIGVGVNGQIKFTPQSSVLFQYDAPLKIINNSKQSSGLSKANFAFGYQVETSGHSFQIYFTTANGILPQDIYLNNQNDWRKGDFMLGFTITRLWNF